MKRFLLLNVFIIIVSISSIGQDLGSYVYIEGIKGIPFKLRLNDVDVASVNKGYYLCLINTSGDNRMDIEFSNNQYPNQQFILDANDQCAFGFKLAKTAEDKFYLLDLVNNGKIIETNSNVNIGLTTKFNTLKLGGEGYSHLSTKSNNKKMTRQEVKKMRRAEEYALKQALASRGATAKQVRPVLTENRKPVNKPINKSTTVPQSQSKPVTTLNKGTASNTANRVVKTEPVDEKTIPLKQERRIRQTQRVEIPKNEPIDEVEPVIIDNEPITNAKERTKRQVYGPKIMINSCSQLAMDREVNNFVSNLSLISNDEDKFIAVKRMVFAGCITCNQLYRIVACFETPEMKLAATEVMRFNISDLQNLLLLEGLFKLDAGKEKLKELMYE